MKWIKVEKELFGRWWNVTITIGPKETNPMKIMFDLLEDDELEQLAQELIAAGEAL